MNRNLTNAEILATAGIQELINAGKVVIIDKVTTSNPDFTNLYLMTQVEGIGSSSNEAQELLLGWTAPVMRCIANAKTEIADKFQLGSSLPGDFTFRVTDHTEPQFKGHGQRRDSDGNLLYTEDNKPIFRQTTLVSKRELEANGHSLLTVGERVRQSPIQASQLLGAQA